MAPDSIRRLFFTPPVAVARLGGGLTPLVAFEWTVGHPHAIAETRIRPAWTLEVRPDGAVRPTLPTEVVVRDGDRLRPLAPFLELWALTGDGPEPGWLPRPVTPALLAANGVAGADLTFTVSATNRKAVRRTGNRALAFGTFPPVRVRGDDHRAAELPGASPPGATPPMIPRDRTVPLGRFQVLRPVAQPANPPWPETVRVDVVRVRFTPARGRFYGPPAAATPGEDGFAAVPPERAFLDPAAGWFGANHLGQANRAVPGDTVDDLLVDAGTADERRVSLGVVDDTCDAQVTAELTVAGAALRARATVTVGPPDFAPDRRPFVSLADEINDREHDPARDAAMSATERSEWVEDLFERIFETVAMLDLDFWRAVRARDLAPTERGPAIADDGLPDTRAMGARDLLRDPEIAVPPRSRVEPLPLSQRARDRHRALSESRVLASWVKANPDRLRALVREPLTSPPSGIQGSQDMRMPAFMRASNAGGLSLTRWQYDLLMAWADAQATPGDPGSLEALRAAAPAGPAPMSAAAAERRRQVLQALEVDP